MKKIISLLAIVSCISLLAAFQPADDDVIKKVIVQLSKWVDTAPQEKVYVHLDKPYYAAGDDIWFKAYVTIGEKHQLSALSGILNVELINDRSAIKRSLKLPLSSGVSWGDIHLPDTLQAGSYRIRAYTNYMRNAGDDYFFCKTLFIGNAIANNISTNSKNAGKNSALSPPIQTAAASFDVQFFPEGGTLINGLRNKVGFKATGTDGRGVNINGVIKDDSGIEVAKLGAAHFGMGYFNFSPETGKTYKAFIAMPDGSQKTFALPVAAESGYTLSLVNNEADNLTLKIGTSQNLFNGQELNVVAQQNGHVYYAAKAKITTAVFAATIPKSRFPTGIVQFTLFSASGEPLNERLVFVQNDDLLKLNVGATKPVFAAREKTVISLNAKNVSGTPVTGSFSVAVIDESKVAFDEADETTILSSLLLTSDLKGYIEKPNYYFAAPSAQTKADLDALMLTQGYRRFVWKQVLDDVLPAQIYKPEKSLTISGTVKNGSKPSARSNVTLFATAGGPFILDTLTDEQGRFAFNNMIFQDSVRFVVQARSAKNSKNVEIELDKPNYPLVTANPNAPDIINDLSNGLANYLKNSKNAYDEQVKYGIGDHAVLLKEVVIREKKKPLENSGNLNGPGSANQVIKSDLLNNYSTLEQALVGRAFFVNFRNGQAYSTRTPNRPMLIVLDGVQMGESFSLNEIPPTDVASVEVLRTIEYTGIYGGQGGNGVLIVNTKRGGDEGSYAVRYAPGIVTTMPRGYYRSREFYAPRYDDPKVNPAIADLRSTIFWKPNIITDKEGNASFDFYNADSKGSYGVVVEGIDNDGNLGRQVFRYRVE